MGPLLLRNADAESERFCYNVLELQNQCLGFDFIGTAVDESVDDIGTVEVPSSWKTSILELGNLEMYFDLYAMLSPALQPKVHRPVQQMTGGKGGGGGR
jgi:exportin-7